MTLHSKPYLLTEEGLNRLTVELETLRTSGREAVAERLHNAFQDGQDDDFVENAELEAARNELSFLEGKILELEEILSNYQIIANNHNGPHETVQVGDWVTVVEEGTDEEERYHLVGAAEADPTKGRISNESPLGRSLLGSKVDSVVRVSAPNGLINFRIAKID